jgi:hypothetical protein
MLGHDGKGVAEVVLDQDPACAGGDAPPAGMVEGMHVVHHDIRGDAIQLKDLVDLRSELGEAFRGFQVTVVRAEMQVPAARQGRGVFQVASECEHDSAHIT